MTTDIQQKIKRSRLDIAREKAAQATALLQKLEAQEQARTTSEKRQLDTRRKVLLGAYLLNKIELDAEAKSAVLDGLDRFLTRPAERALFNLPALPPESASSPQGEGPGLLPTPSIWGGVRRKVDQAQATRTFSFYIGYLLLIARVAVQIARDWSGLWDARWFAVSAGQSRPRKQSKHKPQPSQAYKRAA